jgi:cysteine desulfurase family protein (TIGR01976 family)
MTEELDTAWVRSRFPALDPALALFDNAGGSVPARDVVDRARAYLDREMVQLGASYPRSRRATELFEAGLTAGADLVAGAQGEIVLGASTTANLSLLARAMVPLVGPGDEIVVTDLDHEANRGAWLRLATQRGATVRTWRVDRETHELTEGGLLAVLSPRTKVVCFTHCSNVVGSLHDVRTFADRIHDAGALACVDGVAFAPHRRVDVRALGVDAYALSLYKVYGPHLGLLWVSPSLLPRLENQNHFFHAGSGTTALMPGSASHELVAAIPGVTAYLRSLDAHHGGAGTLESAFEHIARHEEALARRLLSFLRGHPRVRLIGRADASAAHRVPTITFTVEGTKSAAIPSALDERGIGIRFGHFYAPHTVEAFGLEPDDGVVRVSMVHYNTRAEVDRLVAALDEALGG